MKKIVSIVAALAMATAMFADPAININIAEFTGNASVTWGVDLDRGTTGFKNGGSANLKIHFLDEGTKATSSDASVWGEIEIKAGAIDNAISGSATVEKAKLHVGPAWIGIKSGDTKVGAFAPALATRWGSITTGQSDVTASVVDVKDGKPVYGRATEGLAIGYAMDKMFSVELNFRSKEVEAKYPQVKAGDKNYKNWDGDENGQKVVYSDRYGLSFKATLDMVENLGVAFGVEKDLTCNKDLTDEVANDYAIFGKVDYKLGLNDKFYVKPGVGVLWGESNVPGGEWKSGVTVAAGVLLGWGAEEQDSNLKYLSAKDKVSNGFSVATVFDLGKTYTKTGDKSYKETFGIDPTTSKIVFGLYDTTFVEGLTFGADMALANVYSHCFSAKTVYDGKEYYNGKEGAFDKADFMKTVDNTVYIDEITLAAKYAIKLDDKTITPQIAVVLNEKDITNDSDKAKDKMKDEGDSTYGIYAEKFYLGAEFAGFVPYTTFSVDYETKAATVDYMFKGYLNFTCKIAF